jgi:uncharacterized protein involved in exopolysaccharide biosynthesis/MinD-like ATPase involved in chromosome partitioning or flagellar assembly
MRRGSHPLLDASLMQGSAIVPEPWLTVPNVIRLLWRRIGLLTVGTCLLTLLGIVITLSLPRTYESETMIVVDARQSQVSTVPDVMSALPPDSVVLRSEVDALQSNGLIQTLVEHANLTALPEFNPTLRDVGIPWSLVFWLDKQEQKAAKLRFHDFKQRTASRLGLGDPETKRPEQDDPVATAAAIYRSKKLNVTTDGRSLTMRLSVKSSDAALAAKLANLHADLYLEEQFASRIRATDRARSWLSERLIPLRADVQRADSAVQKYREQNRLIVSSQGVTVTVQQLSELNTQLSLVRAEKAQNQARLDQIRKLMRSGTDLESVPDVLQSQLVQRLREQEAQVARMEADAASRYVNADHPALISAKAQLGELRKAVAKEVSKIATSLQRAVEVSVAKEKSLQDALDQLTKRASDANLAEVKLRELERDAESTRTLYETLLNRHQETSFGPISRLADSRIISAAVVPLSPDFPKYGIFFAVSILFAAAASTGLAFVVDGYQDRLRSPTECLDMLGVRGIGLLPRIAGWRSRRIADCIVNEGMPRDAVRSIVEILRAARTEGKTRSIAITSSVPHEGKSVLAVWLARVSAMIGLKVLLIDADLRRPAVAKYLKLEDESVRASRDVTTGDKLSDLRRVDPLTGLHYLTCKTGADRVQGIASLEGVERLIQEASAIYDLIVVDGAPILAAPESLSICQMTDGVIFAVRWGITPPRQARQALSMLRPTRAHLVGAVVTRADVKRHQKYAYGDVGEVYYRHKAYYRA